MWTRLVGMLVTAAGAAMAFGCSLPRLEVPAVVIEDKVFTVTPASVQPKAGIVTDEVADMKVAEGIEKGSGSVVSPAKLTEKLKLRNSSTDQTIRFIGGRIQFIDAQGQPIKVEEKRIEPTLRFSSYGGAERLDPGQEATQSVDVEFPAEALKEKRLKEIRIEFAYIPSPYREETVNFAVSIGAGK